jgi:serine/threonine protein kinase
MPIQSGTHVGPYEIISAIGAGGMGEVYRAHDPKLDMRVPNACAATEAWTGFV